MQTPYQQTTTYAPQSIADTPEAKALLDVPLDFAADPTPGRGTDLAEQEVENRYNSAFSAGVPSFIREAHRAREGREIREAGAANEMAAAADAKNRKITAELERRRLLLPSLQQTGTSGYGTQIVQPQPSFLQNLAVGAVSGLAGNPKI